MAKMDFWPNLDLSDLAEYGLGLPQYPRSIPNKPFSWRIQSIKKLLPAWCVCFLVWAFPSPRFMSDDDDWMG